MIAILTSAAVGGIAWGMGMMFFHDPKQAANVAGIFVIVYFLQVFMWCELPKR